VEYREFPQLCLNPGGIMNDKIRWGIIGAGGIALRRTLPILSDITNAEVIAIMDKKSNDMIHISTKYHIPNIYEDENDLLKNPDIDAVYVASPVSFHKDQALKVLSSGKHLLLEKPLGLSLEEAKEIVDFAKTVKVKSGAAMVMRFHDGHRKIKEIIQNGDLGEIVSCRGQLTCWFPEMKDNWRQQKSTAGGGALMDMGIHTIDLLKYLLQDKVSKVAGIVDNKVFHYEVEDSASALLKMQKGATCYIDAYNNIPDDAAHSFLEVYGTKGSVIAKGTIGQESAGSISVFINGSTGGYESLQERDHDKQGILLNYDKYNIYARQLQAFSECILQDTLPEISLDDAYDTMKIIDAIYQSSSTDRFISL